MKVWLAPSAFWPSTGGVEELTLKTGQHLQRQGHEVTVVTHRWPAHLPARAQVAGLDVRRIDLELPSRHPRTWLPTTRSASRAAQQLCELPVPDLIHVQCPSSQTGHLARHARRCGIPLVLTTQGETYMDAGRLYERSPFARRDLRTAALQAAALTACSRHAADGAAAIAARFRSARVVPNGVDPQDWADLPVVDRPVIAAWGRHVPQKGLDLLVEAFADVRAVEPHAELLIGGAGPETARLHALAGPGVRFLGLLDRRGVRDLLGRAAVVAVPSRIEPFGIVALEAMAAGRGVVWSVRGGLAEATGGLGRGVDPMDRGALARALRQELADPVDPQSARQHAAHHSWSRITEGYLDVYRSAVS